MSTGTRTRLQQIQEAEGVEFYVWDGWPWPSSFGDPVGEYLAVRTAVGIVDSSGLRKWELRGADAVRAADRIVTQDCSQMHIGRVHYTPVCDANGMMVDDITVFRTGADRVMLVSGLTASEEHFASAISGFDVELVRLSEQLGSLQLQGPRSRQVLARVTDVDLATLPYFHCAQGTVAGRDCLVSRTGYSGELGYELFCSHADAGEIWEALRDAGQHDGIRPYGLEAADYLRVESGLIFVTFDYMPGEWTPYELGLGRAVKLDAAGFVGKEALLAAAGRAPRRRIAGLAFDGDMVPDPGSPVLKAGREVGAATVCVRSVLLDQVLGLALVEPDLTEQPGSRVEVAGASAEVRAVPFWDPERVRPRS